MNKELSVKDLESVNYFSNENLVDVINAATVSYTHLTLPTKSLV